MPRQQTTLPHGDDAMHIHIQVAEYIAIGFLFVAMPSPPSQATRRPKVVRVNDKMQRGYSYSLTAPAGRNFDREFRPDLTPKEMLALGVFCGKYMTDCRKEFPASWFAQARLSQSGRDCSLNYFGVDASQPLSVWRRKGWLHPNDPRGWFQWYCRYYIGRRMPEEDARQIKRWKAIRRHIAQIKRHCEPGDPTCRPRPAPSSAALGL
jgi:hypothetical protein